MDIRELAIGHACDAASTAESRAESATWPTVHEDEGDTRDAAVERCARQSQAWSAVAQAWAAIAVAVQQVDAAEPVLRHPPSRPAGARRAAAVGGLQTALRSAKTYRDPQARYFAAAAIRAPFLVLAAGLLAAVLIRIMPTDGATLSNTAIAIQFGIYAVLGGLGCRYAAGVIEHIRSPQYVHDCNDHGDSNEA